MWFAIIVVWFTAAGQTPAYDSTSMLDQDLPNTKVACEKFVKDFKASSPLFKDKLPDTLSKVTISCLKAE